MKTVQDFYFKKAQKEGYPARSIYKLEEAQQKYQLLHQGDKVLDLGCHPGSWSLYAAKVIGPSGLVIGVDLNKGKQLQVAKGSEIRRVVADISLDETLDVLIEQCPAFDAVLSDIAPHTTGHKWADQQKSLELSRRVFEVALRFLKNDGAFYCKVFEGEDFKEFFETVRPYFQKAKIVKPKSSRSESREVFVMGLNFKK